MNITVLNYNIPQHNRFQILSTTSQKPMQQKPSNPEQKNLQFVTCYTSQDYILLQKSSKSQNPKQITNPLIINRKDETTDNTYKITTKYNKKIFSSFLGITLLQQQKFVVFCQDVNISCNVNDFHIFQISSLFFLNFNNDKSFHQSNKRKIIYSKIRDLNVLLSKGFYFSNEYNLTRTLQNQKKESSKHFTWNKMFLKYLDKYPEWQTPIIQGYVGYFDLNLQGIKLQYMLISRRSLQKGGTRYFDRGINDQGFVSNYVQTEQILKLNQYLMSDVQIRGNVPLFFQQKGLRTKIKLTRGYQLTHQSYIKYMIKMIQSYHRIFWINLLCQIKKGQLILIKQLEKHLQEDCNHNVKYFYFDFHKITQHKNFQKVDNGIQMIKNIKKDMKFYLYDCKKNQIIMKQYGVFRTNCLDCLDRTNFFQTKLAVITFQQMLNTFGICFQQPILKLMNDPNEQSQQIINFRQIWANNGDSVSFHYTGTGSTHSDVIRDGQRGFLGIFKHKYKSVTRFYNQNFYDFYKMKLIDQLLNQNISQMETITIPALVNQRQEEFCQRILLDVYLLTWKSPKKIPISIPFLPNDHQIIAISIQQIAQDEKWKSIINQAIDSHRYILVAEKVSQHNLLMVYSKKELKQAISNVQITKVKFKSLFNKLLSTKCAVILRLEYYSTSITFIGCQLQYGRQYGYSRIQNLKDIHRYAFCQTQLGQKQSIPILQNDVIFLFGNMNTNISSLHKDIIVQQFSKNPATLNYQQKKIVSEIIQSDQFLNIQQSLLQYRYYEEEEIKFAPTYKYVKSRNAFDGEYSGWPDRIWYSTDKKIVCKKYGTMQEMRDEHVPVFANFQVQIEKINEQAKQLVSEEIFVRMSSAKGYNDDDSNQESSQNNINI